MNVNDKIWNVRTEEISCQGSKVDACRRNGQGLAAPHLRRHLMELI